MVSPDGQVVLVFNGEIYNFRELRADLEAEGRRFQGQSDTEVLLHLYLAEGSEMLSRLNGIFAFALWDGRDETLLLVRDGLGVKPLYYSATDDGVAFASEIKALVQLLPERSMLDVEALHRYLSFLWCPGDGTPLKGVRKLPPDEAMVVREGRIARRWQWYRLPSIGNCVADLGRAESVEGTCALLRQAVQRQMVADVPVGAFLSGGLDSSAVVAFACEQNPDIRCFTIQAQGGLDVGDAEDLPYARRVAEHLGVSLDVVEIDSQRMAADIENMVYMLDEPLADPAPLNVLYICELARKQGMKVLLSGAGGDDLFTGYRRHLAVQYERLWAWLPGSVRSLLTVASKLPDQRSALGRRMGRLFAHASENGDTRLAGLFAWASESHLRSLYSRDFLAELGETRANEPLLSLLAEMPEDASRLRKILALEQRFFLADHNLTYTDKMSMAAGVEVRVPFLDPDLVEFSARIPDRFKQRGREGKWVLKKALEPYLPHDVIYRPKTGFGAPLRRWMRHELRELLGDYLSVDSLRRGGLFKPDAVQRLIADNDAGRVDAAYTLLSVLCIEIWCRGFVDGV